MMIMLMGLSKQRKRSLKNKRINKMKKILK